MRVARHPPCHCTTHKARIAQRLNSRLKLLISRFAAPLNLETAGFDPEPGGLAPVAVGSPTTATAAPPVSQSTAAFDEPRRERESIL